MMMFRASKLVARGHGTVRRSFHRTSSLAAAQSFEWDSSGSGFGSIVRGAILGVGVFGAAATCKSSSGEARKEEKVDFLEFKPPIGTGSFGVVRIGKLVETNEQVAVKIITHTDENETIVQNEIDMLERVKKAGGHDHIVEYVESVEHGKPSKNQASNRKFLSSMLPEGLGSLLDRDDRGKEHEYWLLFEHVKGEELFDRVVREGPLEEEEAVRIVIQLAKALQFLHEDVKVVHGDIKPENVLLNEKGDVKLCDFGSALPVSPVAAPLESDKIGTVAYAAPELLEGSTTCAVTAAVDVWSLGCVLFVLLSGSPPFDVMGEKDECQVMESVLSENVSFAVSVWENVSSPTKDVIKKMLEKDASKRISMDQVIEALESNF
mmetsp:Transcript_37729/g.61449  ORF Transcript_37729/g.61449 Transcript_37729/m.61449 type:complete len:378 (-) Transcript_37729:2920-4053(-)